jgi:hypothetical protein
MQQQKQQQQSSILTMMIAAIGTGDNNSFRNKREVVLGEEKADGAGGTAAVDLGVIRLTKGAAAHDTMRVLPPSFVPGPHDVLCGRGRLCFTHIVRSNVVAWLCFGWWSLYLSAGRPPGDNSCFKKTLSRAHLATFHFFLQQQTTTGECAVPGTDRGQSGPVHERADHQAEENHPDLCHRAAGAIAQSQRGVCEARSHRRPLRGSGRFPCRTCCFVVAFCVRPPTPSQRVFL